MLKLTFLLVVLFLAGCQGQTNCGAPQCYYPCTDSRPLVDFVFMIDVSASLENIIASVASGLETFIDNLNNNQINPAFAVVLFGQQNYPQGGQLVFSLSTDSSAFTKLMNSLTTSGSIEPGLEVLNQVMNNAKYTGSNLNIAYRNTQNSQKVFILVTNEDADMAAYQDSNWNANLFGVQNWNSYSNNYYCYNIQGKFPNGYSAISASAWASWQAEIDSVYSAIVSSGAFLYMFVPGAASIASGNVDFSQTCNTVWQYCNPDLQSMNSDYSNFSPSITYSNFVANGTQTSLQGLLIKNGNLARCFDVQDLNGNQGATLINNFFTQVVSDLGKCDTTCFNYTCLTPSECNAPISICDCNGVPFSQCGSSCSTLDKNGKCCLTSLHDINNVCCSGALDPCKICTATGAPSSSCVQDCAGTYYTSGSTPPHHLDNCNNCVLASVTNAATCVQDCAGTWYNTPNTPPHFTDNCAQCVVAGTDVNSGKDACGVCFGNNATMNQCGQCGGTKALDGCGNPVCKNITCNVDCNGQSYTGSIPPHHYDQCGNCIVTVNNNINTNAPYCVQDCAGVWFNNQTGVTPPHHVDQCGNCLPAGQSNPACVQDCNGVWGGSSYYDQCHQCVVNGVPPHVCTQDCDSNWYIVGVQTPLYTVDDCGICNTAANFDDLKDHCGICTNTPGYNSTAMCTQDCKGVWSLVTVNGVPNPNRAFVDGCNDCWFANQSSMNNYYMDNCGNCFPSRTSAGWNQETVGYDTQGFPCHCGQIAQPCPGTNFTTCNDNCPVSCGGGVFSDSCGRCPGQPYYNTGEDKCGQCASASHPPNSALDYCGICFGNNNSLSTNPCHICNASACYTDCAGTPLGTATYDLCGVCGGNNSTCDLCGDGKVEGNETCDLGANNGKPGYTCSSTCTAVTANDAGAIAGGIIGGLVGLVALGLAAFFALQYAKKNGLIGNANKQLDMASANSNPLYKNAVNVQHNPLYGQS